MEGREEEDRVEEAESLQRDSQVEEEIKVRDEEGGRMSPRDINKEGLKDPPSREAREKEVPVKEKPEDKAGYEGRPRGHPGSLKKRMEQGDRRTGVNQPTATLKKPRKEAIQGGLLDPKRADTGA